MMMESQEALTGRRRGPSKRHVIIGLVVAVGIGLVVGFCIGYFGKPTPAARECEDLPGSNEFESLIKDGDPTIRDKIIQQVSASNIGEHLKQMTELPHMSGTPEDLASATRLRDIWMQQGIQSVHLEGYDVLLSSPNRSNPNRVYLLGNDSEVLYQSAFMEEAILPKQNRSDVVLPFLGYSPSGTVEGPLVYVNYGQIEDFQKLRDDYNLNLSGTIAIARYGKIFRGSKVKNAQDFGCVGVILYSDPGEVAPDGTDSDHVYPNTKFMPSTGVQRGSILGISVVAGDPRTPGYPATEEAYRIPEATSPVLPTIPAHPISYGDAQHFLKEIGGPKAPEDWQGKLGFDFHIGPGLNDTTKKVRLHVGANNEMKKTYNVIGYLPGKIEPDRYVVLGNHRDAWVFGAVDPTSGTATMAELTRVLGKLYSEGWRPRRTLVFCSWGAEEYGLVGSAEWVEHYQAVLGERTVTYLNVDSASSGLYSLSVQASPVMYDASYQAAKQIPNPDEKEVEAGRRTVYDTWLYRRPGGNNQPKINQIGSGSDHAAFLLRVGIPVIDATYRTDNPMYHSAYSTYDYVQRFVDPEFKSHAAMAQYWGELARQFADSLVLPFNVTRYSQELRRYTDDLSREYGNKLLSHSVSLDLLNKAVDDFAEETKRFDDHLSWIDMKNPVEIRAINDQMMKLERAFTDQAGIPGRPLQKHLIFAPSSHNVYAGSTYPGMVDLLFEIERDADQLGRWEMVKQHLSVITYVIKSATTTLRSPINFGTI